MPQTYTPIITPQDYPDALIERICATTEAPVLPTVKLPEFVRALCGSLSLNIADKLRVLDALPMLSQFQCDELLAVWQTERAEFQKLLRKEWPIIAGLCARSWHDAQQLLSERGGQVDEAQALLWQTTLLAKKFNTPTRERLWLLPLAQTQTNENDNAMHFYAMHPALAVLRLPNTF